MSLTEDYLASFTSIRNRPSITNRSSRRRMVPVPEEELNPETLVKDFAYQAISSMRLLDKELLLKDILIEAEHHAVRLKTNKRRKRHDSLLMEVYEEAKKR